MLSGWRRCSTREKTAERENSLERMLYEKIRRDTWKDGEMEE